MDISKDITDIEHIKPIHDFLITYPLFTPKNTIMVDYLKIVQGQDSAFRTRLDANALMYTGRVPLYGANGRNINVLGDKLQRWQLSFDFIMWRNTGENIDRLKILESIDKLIRWINNENLKRNIKINDEYENPMLPRFSDTEFEMLNASGGRPVAEISSEITEFRFSIIWTYEKYII